MLLPVPRLICTVVEQDLRAALLTEGLRLVYQPQLDLRTHEVVAYEALLRWKHPTRGELPPASFLPLVQGSPVMCDLTSWTVHKALADWKHLDGPPVAVNVCPSVLDDGSFADGVMEALCRHRFPPSRLKLELIEQSLLMRPSHARDVLRVLANAGVRISIDDFGTGYSSLAHLRDLPVSEVKIDRSFVEALPASARSRRIVESLVNLGHQMGIDVVGEGVSHPLIERYLLATGCEIGQGFYLGRPLPLAEINCGSAFRPATTSRVRASASD